MGEITKQAFLGSPLQAATDDNISKKERSIYSNQVYGQTFRTNTVDSVWLPKEFRSSRKQKAAVTKQTLKEFMDNDDIGDFGIIPLRVQHTQQLDFFTDVVQTLREEVSSQRLIAKPELQSSFHVTLDAVGKQLWGNTGWDVCQETGIKNGPQRINRPAISVANMREDEQISISNFMSHDQLKVQRACNKNANCPGLGYKDLNFAIDIHIGTKKKCVSSEFGTIVRACGEVENMHKSEDLGSLKDGIEDFSASTGIENNEAQCFSVETELGFIPQNWLPSTTKFSHITKDKTNVLKEWLKRTGRPNFGNNTSQYKHRPSRLQCSMQGTRGGSYLKQSMANLLEEMNPNQLSKNYELASSKTKFVDDFDHGKFLQWTAESAPVKLHFSQRFIPERNAANEPSTMILGSEATPVVRSEILWLPHNLLCKEFKQKQNDVLY